MAWVYVYNEVVDNMPPPNVPLWNKNYFELKEIQNQQVRKEFFPSPCMPKSRPLISLCAGDTNFPPAPLPG